MKRPRLLLILLYIVIAIQVLSFVVLVSGNRPRGRAADEAFSRWLVNRTPENEKNFHREMERLDENAHRIRNYSLIIFGANAVFLVVLASKVRRAAAK
jgi:hypothetical protein